MPIETLGVPAHAGGLVVETPQLTIGVVRAVSRPTGFELELIARRPLDRRSATERQADIRAGRAGPAVAPRRLLPAYDEGIELRVGLLDADGRAHWHHGSWSSSSGDHFEGSNGPSLRTVLRFPPLFDQASVVFAWPEIGFAETVVELALPDRAAVERGTVSIWDAPLDAAPPPGELRHRFGDDLLDEPAVEAGRVVAVPRVLSRGGGAAVVLTRLTAVGAMLSLEVLSVAEGAAAEGIPLDPRQIRTRGPGAAVAVVDGGDASWIRPVADTFSGGDGTFRSDTEYVVARPGGDVLTLLVAWEQAGLPDVCVRIGHS
ncbi:hypothetical protein OHA21_14640 [Actinoplanes sp. NBC_00393]|uniref:hypothetical protein n=1 Tax=Actinoplanes sp. NBC_00393 TaxID=2975953 RepID=UPI002E1DE315